MKLLLTSAGISNPSIRDALVGLLGKPIAEASALFIPTAIYGVPEGSGIGYRVIRGTLGDPFCDMGWKSLGLLELTALPTLKRERWGRWIDQADALLVGGGDCQYLTYWMQQSGLADLLPSLLGRMVYVGLSAGSMIMTRYGTTFGNHTLPPESGRSLGYVDFAIHPISTTRRFLKTHSRTCGSSPRRWTCRRMQSTTRRQSRWLMVLSKLSRKGTGNGSSRALTPMC